VVEDILEYCPVSDLKSISQCSTSMNQVAKELLWTHVAIPWIWLKHIDWESPLVMKQLESLVHTKSITFYHQLSDLRPFTDRTVFPQQSSDWEPLYAEKYLEPFKEVMSYCDTGRLREFLMIEHEQLRTDRGGALFFPRLFCIS